MNIPLCTSLCCKYFQAAVIVCTYGLCRAKAIYSVAQTMLFDFERVMVDAPYILCTK